MGIYNMPTRFYINYLIGGSDGIPDVDEPIDENENENDQTVNNPSEEEKKIENENDQTVNNPSEEEKKIENEIENENENKLKNDIKAKINGTKMEQLKKKSASVNEEIKSRIAKIADNLPDVIKNTQETIKGEFDLLDEKIEENIIDAGEKSDSNFENLLEGLQSAEKEINDIKNDLR